ncbi:phosphoribosylglycinamide formyltransferase [Pseudonocardia halophobica]|uniref:Phosphoribosylglycinamide formyltransferase n=1 Tax=Pseudonocardia halophobica TaxID=29401 RepID=A0A9W6L1B1_9PSEU|nr:phosphoribosylglycinamide formyltransferase [Pseudonocardia halophobica]GLL11423.1 phosphoribosylglycinamide formyltransferase [Pseudonocardia halophobica]
MPAPTSAQPTSRDGLPGRARLVVLASGSGTLLQALLDAARDPAYPAEVVAVGTDRPGVEALNRATRSGVPAFTVRPAEHPDRPAWDRALLAAVLEHRPDLVVSAGFMRILGAPFLDGIGRPVVNTHPALLPAFPGAHAVRDALAHGVTVTGTTVHLVDAGVDTGPILAQEAVPVLPGDTEAELHERIKIAERRLLVATVATLSTGKTLCNREARVQ